MPKITVLTITARDLYLADQTQSLNQQTLQEFEWVIVDAKRDKNREVEKIARFPVQYLCDKERKDYFAGGQAYNWGIVHARGELIYFMSDYVIPSPNSLERHWRIYEKYQKVFISGRTARFDCTPATFVSISGMVGARDYRSGSLPDKKEIERNLFLVQNVTSPAWWSGRRHYWNATALRKTWMEDGEDTMANWLIEWLRRVIFFYMILNLWLWNSSIRRDRVRVSATISNSLSLLKGWCGRKLRKRIIGRI